MLEVRGICLQHNTLYLRLYSGQFLGVDQTVVTASLFGAR